MTKKNELNCNCWNPVVLGATFAVVLGADAFIHGVSAALRMSFLWWNATVWKTFFASLPGVSLSWGGAFVLLVWGALTGFVFGWLLGSIHKLVQKKL